MSDGAAHDFAEDIAAALIGRQDAVVDEEGGGTGVVSDDAQGRSATLALFDFIFKYQF